MKAIHFILLGSLAVAMPTWAKHPVEQSVDLAKTINSLDIDELQATLDLYKSQVNQENVVLLGNLLKQQLEQNFDDEQFKQAVQRGIGVEYDEQQAKALTEFAQHDLPTLIEQKSPVLGQHLEQAVQQIDTAQVAEVLNDPAVKKGINRVFKLFDILNEKD